MVRKFDFVIVGGGILGTALGALAAGAGLEPLVLRRSDGWAPNADTLRNQGWLQSGIMFPIAHFETPSAYRKFAIETYFAGRDLLRRCGLPEPTSGGILTVSDKGRIDELIEKRSLLGLPDEQFHQLSQQDAQETMGAHFRPGARCFRIPDAPFDEAKVLSALRTQALNEGASFHEVSKPVQVHRKEDAVSVLFDGMEIVTRTLVVAAGIGSFELLQECGIHLNGYLQRTPLAVGDAPDDMPASIMIDLDAGFSAVRHERGPKMAAAVVMGTRTKTRHDTSPPIRLVTNNEQLDFRNSVPAPFQTALSASRYTAGYEEMPKKEVGIKFYQPWLEQHGPVIFSSPGRATLAGLAVRPLFEAVRARLKATGYQRTTSIDMSRCVDWGDKISMHYMPEYTFNDAEG